MRHYIRHNNEQVNNMLCLQTFCQLIIVTLFPPPMRNHVPWLRYKIIIVIYIVPKSIWREAGSFFVTSETVEHSLLNQLE